MEWLELKIPPPLQALLTAGLIWLTAQVLPTVPLSITASMAYLMLAAMLSAVFAIMGLLAFYHAKTTVHPHCPEQTSTLVTTGIYGVTRNPMYLSLVILLCGFVGFLGAVWALVWVLAFIASLTRFQIKPEERALAKQFPNDFAAYCQRVRRWI